MNNKKEAESWWDYIRTFDFWKQIALMISALLLLTLLVLFSISFFTHHGQKIKVPDMTGYTIKDLKPLEKKYSFEFIVRDSVFDIHARPGTILGQTPRAGSIVKKRRTFYLVLASYGRPMLRMPDLIDLSYRQAISLLETYGLDVGQIIYVHSMANGAVLGQRYQGRQIVSGDPISQGSKIDLEVGSSSIEPKIEEDSIQTEGIIEEEQGIEGAFQE